MEITFERIAPLIVQAEAEGSKMYVTFEVPNTGEHIESSASIRRVNSLQSTVTRAVKRQASRELRRTTSRILRQALGSGFLGRTARTIVNTSTRNTDLSRGYTEEEKRLAIVEAFRQVADHFQFDERQSRWQTPAVTKAAPAAAMGEFEQRLQAQPITNRYDQEILIRMLIEMGQADGNLDEEEAYFLESFLPSELGRIDDFMHHPPLSTIECEEVTEKVKPSLYLIVRALSLIDFDPDHREDELLREYAHMLDLREGQIAEADRIARNFVLERIIDPHTPREELFTHAARLHMTEEEALRVQIQLKKRQ